MGSMFDIGTVNSTRLQVGQEPSVYKDVQITDHNCILEFPCITSL